MVAAAAAGPAIGDAEPSRCSLCGGRGQAFRKRRGFDILLCAGCGNAYVPESQIPTDLEEIYSKGYFEGEHGTGYPGYLDDAPLLERNFVERLDFVERSAPPGRRLLDVGAAYGLLLKVARQRGWDASGVEIAPECAVEAARISQAPVACGDFLEVPLAGHYDVITMLDVIEHFRDPVRCIRRAFDLLTPGGLLIVETGNVASPWARILGDHWYFLDPPAHLFYFSRDGLTSLLRRSGFRSQVHVERTGRRVSTANICFKLAAAAPAGPVRAALDRAARARPPGSLYLDFGDGMIVAARKP